MARSKPSLARELALVRRRRADDGAPPCVAWHHVRPGPPPGMVSIVFLSFPSSAAARMLPQAAWAFARPRLPATPGRRGAASRSAMADATYHGASAPTRQMSARR